jgi:hypothetical protein
MDGALGTRARRLFDEWRILHQAELLEDWSRAQARQPLKKIEPLEQDMIPQIIEVKALDGYKLWLRFRDGMIGTVDLSTELWGPMFEPLTDRALFAKVAVHPELHMVTWPNGADLSPEFLYKQAAQAAVAADAPQTARR